MKIHIASYLVIRMSAPLATQGTHRAHTGHTGHTHRAQGRVRVTTKPVGGVGPAQADPSRLHHLHAMQPACLFHPLCCNNMRNNASDNDWLGVGRPVQYLAQPLQTPAIVNSLPWWPSSILIPQTEFYFFSIYVRYTCL